MIQHINELRRAPPRKGLRFRLLSHEEAAHVHADHEARKVTSIDRPGHHEYTRILLAAKEGGLAPGEADRRISRMGGQVRIKPLPKPPS